MLFSVLFIKVTAPSPGYSSRVGCNLSSETVFVTLLLLIPSTLCFQFCCCLFTISIQVIVSSLPRCSLRASSWNVSIRNFIRHSTASTHCFQLEQQPPLPHINPSHSSISSRVFLEGIFHFPFSSCVLHVVLPPILPSVVYMRPSTDKPLCNLWLTVHYHRPSSLFLTLS